MSLAHFLLFKKFRIIVKTKKTIQKNLKNVFSLFFDLLWGGETVEELWKTLFACSQPQAVLHDFRDLSNVNNFLQIMFKLCPTPHNVAFIRSPKTPLRKFLPNLPSFFICPM